MKKFVLQAFQQKYYLPSKVKEKSANYLKNVQKMGKHLPTVRIVKKAISRKQNQYLSSAQKLVISFVYNFIWKRISHSFVDLITPSIVKSNQLTKITDYRSHVGFSQGTELLLKTFKINNEHHLSNGMSNGVQMHSFYINEKHNKHNENLVVNLNKEVLIPSVRDLKHQQEHVNTEYVEEKNMKNPIYYETNDSSFSPSHLKPNDSSSFVSSSNLHNSMNKERSTNVKVHNTRKVKDKNMKNFNRYQNQKTSSDLQRGQSNQSMDTNSQLKTYAPINNKKAKKSNKRGRSVDGKNIHRGVENQSAVKGNVSLNAGSSLKIKTNINKELYTGLTKHDYKSNTYASLIDQGRVPLNNSKTNLQQDNPQENVYSFVEEDDNYEVKAQNKSKMVLQQVAGNKTQILNKSYSKSTTKTNQDTEEGSNLSTLQNKTTPLQNKTGKTFQARLQSKPSKSYKKKKRISRLEHKLKKVVSLNQPTKDFESNSKKIEIKISEERKPENKTPPLTKTDNSSLDPTSKYFMDPNQNQDVEGISDEDNNKTPETFKTNLIVFDTTQDEAQLLITEQGVGNKTKSSLINLKRVVTEESLSKRSNKKTKSPVRNNSGNHSEMEPMKTVTKNLKPATAKPWKRNKDVSVEKIRSKSKNSKKYVDSGTTISSQKYDNTIGTKKKDLGQSEGFSIKTSFSNPDVLSGNKINDTPLDKTSSLSNVLSQNKEERSPKRSSSMESSSVKVLLPTKNQMPQLKDKTSSNNYYVSVEEHNLKTGSNSKEENNNEAVVTINKKTLVKTKNTEVYYDNPTNALAGNESKSNVVTVEKKLDISKRQVKDNFKDSANSTKNLEYENALIKVLSNKKVDNIASGTRITNSTPPAVEKDLKKEMKLEKLTQLQDVRVSVASPNPKSNNLGKNEPATVSNTNTRLKSSDAHVITEKNKIKDTPSLKTAVSLNSKTSAKSTNKTNLEHNDLLLSKTVADISKGLNKILGKEEFKSKMNQMLHNFTVTGQKQQATNIQRQIKSQEIVKIKTEKKNKSQISKESDVIDKSMSNEELNTKLRKHDPLNTKPNLAKNIINNNKSTEANSSSGSKNDKENILHGKPNTSSQSVSVRPALVVHKHKNPHENTTKSGEINVQRQTVTKSKTTTIVSSPKVNTLVSNKSEPKIAGTTNQKDLKQQVQANSNPKNKEVDKKVVKPRVPAQHVKNNSIKQNDMLRKLVKRRPSD